MRGLRSTLALLLVLVALGAYIYFVTWKQAADSGSKQEKVFASLTTDKIDEITVKSESGDVTTVKKDGGAWKMVSPTDTKASESTVSGITSALGSLELVRVIDPNPANLSEFGLEKPRIEVQFNAEGKPAGRLYVGDKTPTGASFYARKDDDKRVFLIASFQDTAFNHSTFDLRDKTLVTVARDKTNSIDVMFEGTTTVLTKKDKEWRVTSPIDARADFSSSEAIIGRVESAQMKSIVAENVSAADLKKYGLDKPTASVTINFEGASASVAFGSAADDQSVYARDPSRMMVVTVEKSLADDFKKKAEDFRRRDVFDFRAFNASRAELSWGGKSIVFERVKTEGDKPDDWKRSTPSEKVLDRSKVETLLTGLADIRATSFKSSTAGTGLDAPALTVYMKYDQSRSEERASFGKSGTEAYASRPDDMGAMVIEADKLTEALKTLDELIQ